MSKSPQPFTLPEEAIRSLKELLHKGVHSARMLNRARILIKLDQGIGPRQVAREVGVSEPTVFSVRNKANALGWQTALAEGKRRGRPTRIPGDAKAKITALACSNPPTGHARWTLRLLADKAVEFEFVDAISHEGVREILKKTNLSLI